MRDERQKQDVTFLALAVAVLALAVAIFVGMRVSQKRPKEPTPAPVEQVETAPPVVEKPGVNASTRDPFKTQGGKAGAAGAAPAAAAGVDLKLVGIVKEAGDKPIAIIRSQAKRYYAKLGSRVGGYTVVEIGEGEVTLEGAGDRIRLVLREPEPVEQ